MNSSHQDASAPRRRASFTEPLMKLSSYVLALRPWSFSASLMPVLLGCALAYKVAGELHVFAVFLTAVTAIAVHAAGNVVNTFYDFVKGVDVSRSDDRVLVDHLLTKDEIATLGVLLYLVGCLGFSLLSIVSSARMEHLAFVFFGGLSSSFLYTGGPGLKYVGLGDILILIIFGPISVLFSFLAQTGYVQWPAMLYAVPLALNTEAILHSNNTRDLQVDKQAGIVSLAITIGYTASRVLYAVLLFTPYVLCIVHGVHYSTWLLLPCVTMPTAFKIEREFRTVSMQDTPNSTAKLNAYLGLCLVVAILMSDARTLPYLTPHEA
ncbi:ubiA prenyltransferase domain-containing protein 1 homolog [Pollicipes pollicipes]|uniref:ubiA prenyltransferase domain-containing protein 1 homolog n=1 Tax=Pollicipes pollicipes TaxID=41117 RepID=UPI001884F6E2|nr:ubiA prenyltransferase domain-containing protein 1 homolog [Pollicipes pollicipes]XP_037068248.1 ubiA prenyltransferase domain-containing protein 1 homolog [Pollicipes pollicipes]